MKVNKLEKTISFTLNLYILSLYLLTYREGLNNISNLIAATLTFLIVTNMIFFHKNIALSSTIITTVCFIIFSMFMTFTSFNIESSSNMMLTLVQIFVVMLFIASYTDNISKIRSLFRSISFSGVIASIYILLNSDLQNLSRLGNQIGNLNDVGMIFAISTLISLYFLIEKRNVLNFTSLIINLSMSFLTGSRTAFLFLIFGLFFITIFGSKAVNKLSITRILIICVFVFFLYFVIFEISVFAEIIGVRIISFIDFVGNDGTIDTSIDTRYLMIRRGWELFLDKPLFGYGLNTYRHISGFNTYSHNNFIELLVGVGLIGTILYYFSMLFAIANLIKIHKKDRPLVATVLSIIVGFMFVATIGRVFYYMKIFTMIMFISSVIPIVLTKSGKTDSKISNKRVNKNFNISHA